MTAPPAPARLDALTSLRFFAAAAIVLFHMQGAILPVRGTPALALGVSFFFVLSGFILTYVYGDLRRTTLADFYWHRFARLWPLHAATFALMVATLLPVARWSEPERQATAVLNLAMLQAWVPVEGVALSFNSPSWSISAEWFFYLAFPLLARVRRIGLAWCVLAVATIAALAWLDATGWVPPERRWVFSVSNLVLQAPYLRLLEFATGVLAARWLFSGRLAWFEGFVAARPVLAEAGALAAVFGFAWVSQDVGCRIVPACPFPSPTWMSQSGGMLAFAFALVVFAVGRGPVSAWLRHPLLVRLGEISFATYLLHQLVIKNARRLDLVEHWGWGFTTVAVVALTYAGSWMLWAWIEVPARRWLLARRKRPAIAPMPQAG